MAQICKTDNFIFPEGVRPISPVYELSATPSLPSFQKEVKISIDHSAEGDHALLRFMTASRVPRWDSKLTPLYEFKPLSGMFEPHSQTGVIFLSQLDCYLTIVKGTSKHYKLLHVCTCAVNVFRDHYDISGTSPEFTKCCIYIVYSLHHMYSSLPYTYITWIHHPSPYVLSLVNLMCHKPQCALTVMYESDSFRSIIYKSITIDLYIPV